jgi:heavy metal efflux system protein
MFDKIISFSINNKLVICFLTLCLIVWGSYSLSKLPIDAVPDITNNQVQIITLAPALGAQEVEKFITAPLEMSFAYIPKQLEIRSISRSGLSVITIVFEDDADLYLARQLVSEQLIRAKEMIPADIGLPELAPITTGLGEIYQYVLEVAPAYKDKYTLAELRTIQDWVVKKQMMGIQGVAEISSYGGLVKQYEVSIDPERLKALDISLSDVFKALSVNNENAGASYIEKNRNAYFIRSEGMVENLDDIRNIVVSSDGVTPLLIEDIGTVKFGSGIRYGALTKNGEGEVVGGVVLMLKGENSEQVIKRVEKRVEVIQKALPKGISIVPFINRAELIERAIHTVKTNLMEGGLIVIFVLVFMLGNFRAGLIVASVIPLALLFALGMMNVFGVSANLMSLGAIDFGLVVDGAVIIVEGVVHYLFLSTKKQNTKLTQIQMDEIVLHSTVKIRGAASFGEVIILVVYLPILALSGIEGKMFGPMAQTVAFAIMGAMILSLTYVPMASALFLDKKINHKETFSDKVIDFFYDLYQPILVFCIKNKQLVLGLTLGLFAFSLWLFSTLGGEFIPSLDEGNFAVETRIASGSSISQSVETFSMAEKILKKFPEVKQVVSRIGSSEIPTDPMPFENGDLMIILKEKSEWSSAHTMPDLAKIMEDSLAQIPGFQVAFMQPIQMRTNELISGVKADVGFKIFGDDLDILYKKAQDAAKIIEKVNGAIEVRVEPLEALPQIVIDFDSRQMAHYGLKIKDVNDVIRTSFAGAITGAVYEGERRFDLVVRLGKEKRNDLEQLKKLYIETENPQIKGTFVKIPLEQIAEVKFKNAPMQVSRENGKRRISVTFNVRDRDVESAVDEVKTLIDKQLGLPEGYYYIFGGQFENLLAAKQRLTIAVPAALFIIFMLLYFTFKSFSQSLIIFSAIPLSAIGGVFALWLRGMYFSISAGVGFIALFGVAVLNGIVLIGYINDLKKEGIEHPLERILKATKVRFRPVIMTATVASLGFIPMALSHNAGAEVQKPLATVVIGGLISATFLTLIVLPIIYVLIEKNPSKMKFDFSSFFSKISFGKTLVLLLVPCLTTLAQSNYTNIKLDEAIQIALEHNLQIKTSQLLTKEQELLSRASIDLPKTNIDFQYGKIQDVDVNDYTIYLNQSFALPKVYQSQKKIGKANAAMMEQQTEIAKNRIKQEIRTIYYQLLVDNQRLKLMENQDSIYAISARASQLRFTKGEANSLENITTSARSNEVKNKKNILKSEIGILKLKLNRILNKADTEFDVNLTESIVFIPINIDSSTSKNAYTNPHILLFEKQLKITENYVSLEKARFLPTFNIGYFNQSILHVKNAQGIMAGIAVPLWFSANQYKIQASKIVRQAAETNLSFQKNYFEKELSILINQKENLQQSLDYYQTYSLVEADKIIGNATKNLQNGELDYLEFAQNVAQAWLIKESYFQTIQSYNQTTILIASILNQ